jgi:hypothetical protein
MRPAALAGYGVQFVANVMKRRDLPQPPPATPLPDLSDTDMDRFHHMAAGGQLAEILYRLAGYNVVPFRPNAKSPDRP